MKFGTLYEDFAKNMNRNSVSVAFLTVIIYMHIPHERKNEKLVFVKTAHIIQHFIWTLVAYPIVRY